MPAAPPGPCPQSILHECCLTFSSPQIIVTKEYLHLEPIGIVLVFFFFAIVVIQFIAMLFHR
jgi:hypothetical protein